MKNLSVFIFFFIITLNFSSLSARINKIDSLYKELEKTETDTDICRIYLEIGNLYQFTDLDNSLKYYNKSLKLAQSKGLNNQEALSTRLIGVIHSNKGDYNLALEHYFRALELSEKFDLTVTMARCYNDIGVVYYYQGNYDKALEHYFKAIEIAEKLDYKVRIAGCHNNIGVIFHEQKSFDKAIEHNLKALELHKQLDDARGMSINYNNIGIVHNDKGEMYFSRDRFQEAKQSYNEAINYHQKSLKIKEKNDDKRGMSSSYNNLGLASANLGGLSIIKNNKVAAREYYDGAIDYYYESLEIDKELGDKIGQAIVLLNLADLHNKLIEVSEKPAYNSILNSALNYGLRAYDISLEIGALLPQNRTAYRLKETYKIMEKYKDALHYADIYISTLDSLFNEDKTRALAEMQTIYESEQKQQEIDKQKIIIDRQEIDNKRQRIQRNYLIIASFLLILLVLVVYNGYRQKVKNNRIITEKNYLLEKANDEINEQKNEISAQRDMVLNQNTFIEQQNEQIKDSINYAKFIQVAVLPSDEYLDNMLGDHFILYRPKDIVSGDFYWVTSIKNYVIFAVADCTGHGVPGGFMSMLGLSYLKEIVTKKEVISPNIALNNIRESIIEALQQKGDAGSQKEGMDLAICCLDKSTNIMNYSGANIPLILVNNKKTLIKTAPDKQPISLNRKMNPFTNNTIQLNKGDCIYLATDGYRDQFGGDNNKMFTSRRFEELLKSISVKNISEQKDILTHIFEEWKGTNEQVDDITVLGLRI